MDPAFPRSQSESVLNRADLLSQNHSPGRDSSHNAPSRKQVQELSESPSGNHVLSHSKSSSNISFPSDAVSKSIPNLSQDQQSMSNPKLNKSFSLSNFQENTGAHTNAKQTTQLTTTNDTTMQLNAETSTQSSPQANLTSNIQAKSQQENTAGKQIENEIIQFTLKNPPSAMQITLNTISPHAATTPRQQYLLQPIQPLTIPYTPKFYIGATKIRLSIQRVQEFDVEDGKVEIVLLGKKEKKTSRFVPIKAATVDDLKKQLEEKKKEAAQEMERIEEEFNLLQKENEKLAKNRDEFKLNQDMIEKEVKEAEERLVIARQRENDKNEVTRQLRETLKSLEDELRSETEKLEAIQKTKVNTETIILNIVEDIEKKRIECKRLEKLSKTKELELENGKERLEKLKQVVAESDKGTLQQVKDLEEGIKQIDANHDSILKNIIQDVDLVKRESDRFMKQAETAKQKLVKILNENRRKMTASSPSVVDEIFELRAAIQLKRFNEEYLVKEIEALLANPELEAKLNEAEHLTAEQFMVKKTKFEGEIVEYLKDLALNEFKLSRATFFNENDYIPITEEDAKKFEEYSQNIIKQASLDHVDLDALMEYVHLHKLLTINKEISEEIEKAARKIAESNGDDFDSIQKRFEEGISEHSTNNSGELFIRDSHLKSDDSLKVYQLEDFLLQKLKMQKKDMEKLRMNVKQNVLAQWRKRIQSPEDLLKEKDLVR